MGLTNQQTQCQIAAGPTDPLVQTPSIQGLFFRYVPFIDVRATMRLALVFGFSLPQRKPDHLRRALPNPLHLSDHSTYAGISFCRRPGNTVRRYLRPQDLQDKMSTPFCYLAVTATGRLRTTVPIFNNLYSVTIVGIAQSEILCRANAFW